jgi:hypothetical protein
MNDAQRLAAIRAVGEDSALTPEEKETTLRFGKRDDVAGGYTAEAGLTRRAIAHPHVDVRFLTVLDGDARASVSLEEWDGGRIVGAALNVPVGVLSVKSTPRASTEHAEVISERAYEAVDAGEEGVLGD